MCVSSIHLASVRVFGDCAGIDWFLSSAVEGNRLQGLPEGLLEGTRVEKIVARGNPLSLKVLRMPSSGHPYLPDNPSISQAIIWSASLHTMDQPVFVYCARLC